MIEAYLVLCHDDTPHLPEVPTVPPHKHHRAEQNALATEPPTLATVLDEISRPRLDEG